MKTISFLGKIKSIKAQLSVKNFRSLPTVFSAALLLSIPAIFCSQPAFSASLKARPLIVDDDGSQDGMTALSYMLANPKFDIQAITITQGIARPTTFVNNLERMLGRLDVTGIPVGIGRSTPLEGNNTFPEFIRA